MYIVTQNGKGIEKVVVCKTHKKLKSAMNETIENGCPVLYKFNYYNLCISIEELIRLNILEKSDIQKEKFGTPPKSSFGVPVHLGFNQALDKLLFNNHECDLLANKKKKEELLHKKRDSLNNKVKKIESEIKTQTLVKNKFQDLYKDITNAIDSKNSYDFLKSYEKIKKDIVEESDKDIEESNKDITNVMNTKKSNGFVWMEESDKDITNVINTKKSYGFGFHE